MLNRISQAFYLYKVAIIYYLKVEGLLSEKLRGISALHGRELQKELQQIWQYYCSVSTFLHIVSGQTLLPAYQGPLLDFMPDCLWHYQEEIRFKVSTDHVAYLADLIELEPDEPLSIFNMETVGKDADTVYTFEKLEATSSLVLLLWNSKFHEHFYERIKAIKEDFNYNVTEKYLAPYKFYTDSNDTLYDLVNLTEFKSSFMSDGKSKRKVVTTLTFNINDMLDDIKQLFNQNEFDQFPTKGYEISKYSINEFQNSNYNKRIGLYEYISEQQSSHQAYQGRSTRSGIREINDRSHKQEDTYKQIDSYPTVEYSPTDTSDFANHVPIKSGSSSSSSDKKEPNTKQVELGIINQRNASSSSSSSSSKKGNNFVDLVKDSGNPIKGVINYQRNESSSSNSSSSVVVVNDQKDPKTKQVECGIISPLPNASSSSSNVVVGNKDITLVNLVSDTAHPITTLAKNTVVKYVAKSILNEAALCDNLYKLLQAVQNEKVNWMGVYEDAYDEIREHFRAEYENQDRATETRQTDWGTSYTTISERTKKIRNEMRKSTKQLYQVAEHQIAQFFLLLISTEFQTLKDILSKQYLCINDDEKWEKMTVLNQKYDINAHYWLARRIYNGHFHRQRYATESDTKKRLIRILNQVIPDVWKIEYNVKGEESSVESGQVMELDSNAQADTYDDRKSHAELHDDLKQIERDVSSKRDTDDEVLNSDSQSQDQDSEYFATEEESEEEEEEDGEEEGEEGEDEEGEEEQHKEDLNIQNLYDSKRKRESEEKQKTKKKKKKRKYEDKAYHPPKTTSSHDNPLLESAETTSTPKKKTSKATHNMMIEVANDIDVLFNTVSSITFKLSKSQDAIDQIFPLFRGGVKREICSECLNAKRIWDFYIADTFVEKLNLSPGISFVKAHYYIYARKILSQRNSNIDDISVIKEAYHHLQQYLSENPNFQTYVQKIERLYQILVEQQHDLVEIPFTEEDLGLPFLFGRESEINGLKFFIYDLNSASYKLDRIILNGNQAQGPFRLSSFYEIDSSIFFSNAGCTTGYGLAPNFKAFLMDELALALSKSEKLLLQVQKNVQERSDISPSDLNHLSLKFLEFERNKNDVSLDQPDMILDSGGTTNASVISITTNVSKLDEFMRYIEQFPIAEEKKKRILDIVMEANAEL